MSRQSAPANVPLHPTYQGIVLTTMDAILLFESCLSGRLSHCPRRPHDRERPTLIRSGNIFIYEENASGIKRWTDGISWSPSRIMGNYLIYRELERPFPPGEKKRAAKKAKKPSEGGDADDDDPDTPMMTNGHATNMPSVKVENGPPQVDEEMRAAVGSLVDSYPFKEGGLVKKTISIKYRGVPHHLVSYYSVEDALAHALRRPANDPTINDTVPRGDLIFDQNFRAPVDDLDMGDRPLNSTPLINAYHSWHGTGGARSMSVPSASMGMIQPGLHWQAGVLPPHQMPPHNPYTQTGYQTAAMPNTHMGSVGGLTPASAGPVYSLDPNSMRNLGVPLMSSNPDPARRHSTAYGMNTAQNSYTSSVQSQPHGPHPSSVQNTAQGTYTTSVQSTSQGSYAPSMHNPSRAQSSMGGSSLMQEGFTFDNPTTPMDGSSSRHQQESFPSPRTAPRAHSLVGMGDETPTAFDAMDEPQGGEWGNMIGLDNQVHGQGHFMDTQGSDTTPTGDAPGRQSLGGFGPNGTWHNGFANQGRM